MTFKTTSNHGFAAPRVGSRRTRTWVFERHCHSGSCKAIVRRETSTGGYVTLPVRRAGSVYRVRWKLRAPCADGQHTFRYSELVTFTVSRSTVVAGRKLASRLTGRLVGRSPKGGCIQSQARATDRLSGRRTDVPKSPRASFTVDSPVLVVGAPLYFSDTSTDPDGDVVSRVWDFGDPASGAANSDTGDLPTHTYGAAGTYRVTLTVTDDDGLTDTTAAIVTVSP